MAQKSKRNGADAGAREAVRRILSAGSASARSYRLPAEGGPQLTMTGEEAARGNLPVLPVPALSDALASLPSLKDAGEADLELWARRRRFFLMPADRDRPMAIAAAADELVKAGYARILLLTDTPSERDALGDFLRMAGPGIGNAGAAVYLPPDGGARDQGRAFAPVYGYLTGDGAQILALDLASFCRRMNLLQRPVFSGGRSFADLIAEGEPAVLCSSRSADGARNLWRAAQIFSPALSFLFCSGPRRIRDAVISQAESPRGKAKKQEDAPAPEQISFE
ncbi:MAG: hypothetical protein II953_10185 [Clostridia bacterium]|nr:hypothetical protein [Clostridia bacterium]